VLWLRHYATTRKIAGPRPDKVIFFFFFSIYIILPVALGTGVFPVPETLKIIMFLRSRRVRSADNFTAICEPIVLTIWDP
jgi:hypothetical protein